MNARLTILSQYFGNYIRLILIISSFSGFSQEVSPKNILLIIVDDLNTSLGSYGNTSVKTPHIDQLAREGILFNNAYCNFSVCNPSRSSFLTGLRPRSIGVLDNNTPITPLLGGRVSLPYLFKMNKFFTASIGKVFHRNQNGFNDEKAWNEIYRYQRSNLGDQGEGRNLTNGALDWCRWLAAEGTDLDQPDGKSASKAIELIKEEREQPFFLALGFQKPHDPFIAPKEYFDMYDLADCTPPEVPEFWTPTHHSIPDFFIELRNLNDLDKREFIRSYYACISFIDKQIGKVIEALKLSNKYENTLIILVSDHGFHLGEHNWWTKATLFEKDTKIPMVIAGAGVEEKDVTSDSYVELIDLYPTLADVFQLEGTPDYLEGESFKSLLGDPSIPFKSEVYSVVNRGDELGRMVKNSLFRYVEWGSSDTNNKELYNQLEDPDEYLNLANDVSHGEALDRMSWLLNKDLPLNINNHLESFIYPIPTNGSFFIRHQGNLDLIKIFNPSGKEVSLDIEYYDSQTSKVTILESVVGVLIVEISILGGKMVRPIVIN